MSLFDKPILIYSNYCIHSRNFLQSLMKHKDIHDVFNKLNIDVNPETKRRPDIFYTIQQQLKRKIERVPTIIVKTSEAILVLSDKDAFKWLDYQVSQNTPELVGFNPNEMESFSDNYSKFGSTHINDATEQNFTFYKHINGKRVLPGNNFQVHGDVNTHNPEIFRENFNEQQNNVDIDRIEQERNQLNPQRRNMGKMNIDSMNARQSFDDSQYQNLKSQYNDHSVNQQKMNNIDFTSQNFGLSKELGGFNENVKNGKPNYDSQLNQLMSDRGL